MCRSFRSLKPNSSSVCRPSRSRFSRWWKARTRASLARSTTSWPYCQLQSWQSSPWPVCHSRSEPSVLWLSNHYHPSPRHCCCQLHHHHRMRLQHHHSAWKDPRRHPMTLPTHVIVGTTNTVATFHASCVRLERCFLRLVVVLCVCVFFPIYSGHQNRWKYQPGSHRISHPPSFCGGACLNFSREKDLAIPFPRRPWNRIFAY